MLACSCSKTREIKIPKLDQKFNEASFTKGGGSKLLMQLFYNTCLRLTNHDLSDLISKHYTTLFLD